MPFVKGQSGNPAGLKPGQGRRCEKVRVTAREILDGLGFEPFKEAVLLYRSTKKERIKADILIDLCNYVAPKLRAIELKGNEEHPFVVTLNLAPRTPKTDSVLPSSDKVAVTSENIESIPIDLVDDEEITL